MSILQASSILFKAQKLTVELSTACKTISTAAARRELFHSRSLQDKQGEPSPSLSAIYAARTCAPYHMTVRVSVIRPPSRGLASVLSLPLTYSRRSKSQLQKPSCTKLHYVIIHTPPAQPEHHQHQSPCERSQICCSWGIGQ